MAPIIRVPRRPAIAAIVLVGAVLAACSDDGDGAADTTAPPTSTTAPPPTTEPPPPEPERAFDDGPLAEVCPPQISVQIATSPGVRQGPLYSLLGDEPVVSEIGARASAPLRRPDGTVEEVELELRSGGPSVGFRSPLELQATDPGMHFAETSVSDLVLDVEAAQIAVVALSGLNDDMVMWDPASRPEIDGFSTLRDSGIEVHHVTEEPFVRYLAATGSLDPGQLRPGGESAAAFIIAAGEIARQGDDLLDPVVFPAIPQWGRSIGSVSAGDGGWVDAGSVLATVDDGRLDDACIGRFVPIVQEAIGAYEAAPSATNALMASIRSRIDPLERVTAELLDQATASASERGRLAAEFGDVTGGFDVERLDAFATELGDALDVDTRELAAVLTEEFLDPNR